ncbi:hypothetical protein NLU13_8070 [Sarocladium strictum]|uniref:Rhodopsin domain-containing protein n=1 Tax=Sarocladium strictum TaxID=5046 RepID=A0AA39GBF8_SARSR|nr:hypothetical protein NLU13_8070 [Sarocladium strictum]
MLACAMLLALIRMVYKIYMKLDMGLDDWILVLTAATVIPQTVLFTRGTLPNGLGRDIWTLEADQITEFLKYWYIVAIIYFFQTCLIKLAFVAFYMRIFTTRATTRLLWATFVVVALWGLVFVVVGTFVCNPISYLWTQWDGLHKGKCLSDAAYVWANAGSNIALDVWILAIPLWELRKLQLHWKKKVGVALMFGLGACVTVMSILRLKSLLLYRMRDNVTSEFAEVYIWSSIEIGVGVICACLPDDATTARQDLARSRGNDNARLQPVVQEVWQELTGIPLDDQAECVRQATAADAAADASGARPRSSQTASRGRSPSTGGGGLSTRAGRPAGIAVEECFIMERHERSDISLILMKPEEEGHARV